MKKSIFLTLTLLLFLSAGAQDRFPRFRVLAFYNENVEQAHVEFAWKAVHFFKELTIGNGFVFDTTTDMNDMNPGKLQGYDLVMMLNDVPKQAEHRAALEEYMNNGGGWYGFHVSAYNDRHTDWPWFLDFLGGGVFWRNSWPSIPAKLIVDDSGHEVMKGMPESFISPHNEWYQWKPSPRERENIRVLASLSPENYPLGLKDILPDGDLPVVWTNTDYRMIYINMGHDAHAFTDATQNHLFINALRWLASTSPQGNPFDK